MPPVRRLAKHRFTGSFRESQQYYNEPMKEEMGFQELVKPLADINSHQEEPMDIDTISLEPTRKPGDTEKDEEAGTFYPNKLMLRNVPRSATKEQLVNYLENITGQDHTELQYCDEPGDALVTFKAEIDFETVKRGCQAKPLKNEHMEVHRVPVSSSILVENHSPSTDAEDLYNYFQTPRANAGAVHEVKPIENVDKFIIVFASTKATEGVLKATHRLGGRELRVSLYVECLGPSGGRTEPYIFVPPPPVEVAEGVNQKVRFLRRRADMLKCFNDRLSQVHAHATIVVDVLKVNCTLTESMHKVYFLVEKWRENVDKILITSFDFIRLERIQVQKDIWLHVKKAVKESKLNCKGLVLTLADDCSLVVMGRSDTKGEEFKDIQNFVKIKQEQFDLKKLEVSDSKKLKTYQLDLLMLSSFLSDTQTHHRGLTIRLKEGHVAFRGSLMAIREAQVKMYDILQSASSTVMTNIPDIHTSMLSTDRSRVAVRKRLNNAGVDATWEYHDEGVIIVYSLQKASLPKAVHIIQTSFKTEHITLSRVSVWEWKETEKKLLRENCGLVTISSVLSEDVRSKTSTDRQILISITAFCDIMPVVKEQITKFAAERTIYSAVFQLSLSRMKFVSTFWEEKLSIITRLFTKRDKVRVTQQSIQVEGTKKEIDLLRKQLSKLAEQIVCTEELITRKEIIRFVSKLFSSKELEAIACTSKCVLSLRPEEADVQMVFTNEPSECPWVHAVQGDITHLPVDAIVNAANERMDHAGGLAKHIVSMGGQEIQEECYQILKTRGKLSEGDVLVSGPGNLPCKSIIHAVGPRYKGGNKGEEECLRDTVMECLKTASDLGYTSIAIPAISSGIFGYPVKEATRVIVQAVKLFLETNRDSGIRDVQLADILIDTVQEFKKALEAAYDKTAAIALQRDAGEREMARKGVTVPLSPSSRRPRVTAMEGDITQLKVDAIVNTADGTMNHFAGLAAQIIKKGGEEIQKECYSLITSRGRLSTGDVLVSGPGKLPCKSIVHAVVPTYVKGDKKEQEYLRDTVIKCLETVSALGYTSIAIPAISSGGLCYPVEEATRVIVQAVQCYFKTNPDSSITDVNLCDILLSTVQSFKKALEEVEENQSPDDVEQGVQNTGGRNTVINIGGINLTIKQGDITEEVVDTIVNSSNSKLDLNQGTISSLLKTKCGPALESECQTRLSEMTHRKLVTTGAYNLRCKHIVHIDTVYYTHSDKLKTAYEEILEEAENLALNSIALPAIGTGVLNLSLSKSARAMGRALVAHSRVRKSVTSVRVVLHDTAMMDDFTRTLTMIAEAHNNSQTTSSGTHDELRRLYLPEAGEMEDVTTRPSTCSLPEVLKLYIFAANQDKRDDFLTALEDLVESKIVEQEIKDFDKVSPGKLVDMCERYNLQLKQGDTSATVKGMSDDIQMLREEISHMTQKADRKQQESMIANLAQWCYFETTAIGSKRIPYEKRENRMIEDAYQANKDTVEVADSRGTIYIISLKDMTDAAKLNPANTVQIMRKEVIADWDNSNSLLPETWEPMGTEQFVKRVTLIKGCQEYKTVKSSMSQTTSMTFKVKSIERIQNPDLYKQYLAKKTQMDKQNNGMDSEKTLWHGTSSDAIDNINLYGFNRSFCGKNATFYGQGVYFAVNSSYSMSDTYSVRDQSGRKHMYLCKVLVGYPTVGTSGMKVLPTREGKIRYDSATDNTSQPNMYIIFSDIQAYPEYLITFQ